MSTNYIEVCMEIYVDGEFYTSETCWVPEEEDAKVEFRVSEAVYDLFGRSAMIDAKLEVDTTEDMSVSCNVLEGDVVELDLDVKTSASACVERDEHLKVKNVFSVLLPPTEAPETPENSTTESTQVWLMKKICGFYQMLFAVPEPLCEPGIPEPTPETGLVDIVQSSVPVPSVSEQEAELDLNDPEDLSVPDPSRSEQEPVPSEGQEVQVNDAISDLKSLSDDLTDSAEPSGSRSGIDQGSMEAELDLVDPEDSSVPDPSCSEQEPVPSEGQEVQVNDAISDLKRLSDDLTDSAGPSGRRSGINQGSMEAESDLVGSDESCIPVPGVSEMKEKTCFTLLDRVKACTLPQKPVTEVWNNIFIGNEEIARDRKRLNALGITHILNAAAVKKKLRVLLGFPREKDLRETVDTGARYYRGMNITYCGLPTTRSLKINKYLLTAAKFIHKALKNPENKVFIHCTEGVSYAPTLFLAYLIIYHHWRVEDAIDDLIKVRYINPNIDLLKQLAILDEELLHNRSTKNIEEKTKAGYTGSQRRVHILRRIMQFIDVAPRPI